MNFKQWMFFSAALAGASAHAAAYNFDVNYYGGGSATLVAGSDDPSSTMLVGGDSFSWTISAQNSGEWLVAVDSPNGFFPLMALYTLEPAMRTGDFTLTLSNNGSAVYSLSEVGSEQSEVHTGTNTVYLATGLVFDQMQLSYALTSAVDLNDPSQAVDSNLSGLLPIFGAPEQNPFSPGIVYSPVPEPTTGLLLLAGLASLGWVTRRRQT